MNAPKRRLILALLAALLFSAVAAALAAPQDKADEFLRPLLSSPGGGPATQAKITLIVQTDRPLSPDIERYVRLLGGRVKERFSVIQGFSAEIPAHSLRVLAALPWVKRISSDVQVKRLSEYAVPAVGADVANTVYGLDGSGVTVAVLDSGIRADLKDLCDSSGRPRVIKGPNFSPDPKSDSTQDLCGHGTHVAGLIGGNGIKSTGDRYFRTFRGVAPAVKLLSVKVLDEVGVGTVNGSI